MSKTIKQIADELGLPKQRVYRYIKNNRINEAHQKNGVMYYDDAVINLVKSKLSKKTTSSEAHHDAHQNRINEAHHDAVYDTVTNIEKSATLKKTASNDAHQNHINDAVIELLKNELENKNEQINNLQSELNKEREHNREKDKQLLDTLTKLADSQAALAAGQTADKQKALVEKMVEVKGQTEEPIVESEKKTFFNKFFKR